MKEMNLEHEIFLLKEKVKNLEGFMSFVEHIFAYHDLDYRIKDNTNDSKKILDN